jgi:hypothetical protein
MSGELREMRARVEGILIGGDTETERARVEVETGKGQMAMKSAS